MQFNAALVKWCAGFGFGMCACATLMGLAPKKGRDDDDFLCAVTNISSFFPPSPLWLMPSSALFLLVSSWISAQHSAELHICIDLCCEFVHSQQCWYDGESLFSNVVNVLPSPSLFLLLVSLSLRSCFLFRPGPVNELDSFETWSVFFLELPQRIPLCKLLLALHSFVVSFSSANYLKLINRITFFWLFSHCIPLQAPTHHPIFPSLPLYFRFCISGTWKVIFSCFSDIITWSITGWWASHHCCMLSDDECSSSSVFIDRTVLRIANRLIAVSAVCIGVGVWGWRWRTNFC